MMSNYSVILFISCFIGFCLCDPEYFKCYKDRCIRGLHGSQDTQYCNEKEQRCSFCRDNLMGCERENMPRDCDGYCVGLKLSKVQDEAKAIANKNLHLEESRQHLNKSRADSWIELIELKTERDELELTLITKNETIQALRTNFSELQENKAELESDLNEFKEENFIWTVTAPSLVGVCMVAIVLLVCICARQRRHSQGKQDSNDSEENEKLVEETSIEMEIASSVDSAVNFSRDQSRCTTPDASDADCDKVTGNDTCFIAITREEPIAAIKSHDTKVQAEPTDVFAQGECPMGNSGFHSVNVIGDCEIEDNCLRKDTPAVLKGIQPTTASASQANLNQKMYS